MNSNFLHPFSWWSNVFVNFFRKFLMWTFLITTDCTRIFLPHIFCAAGWFELSFSLNSICIHSVNKKNLVKIWNDRVGKIKKRKHFQIFHLTISWFTFWLIGIFFCYLNSTLFISLIFFNIIFFTSPALLSFINFYTFLLLSYKN